MQSFINELLRRNLIRVAGAYAVVGWVLIQLSIALETSLHLPSWFDSLVTSLVFLGFPFRVNACDGPGRCTGFPRQKRCMGSSDEPPSPRKFPGLEPRRRIALSAAKSQEFKRNSAFRNPGLPNPENSEAEISPAEPGAWIRAGFPICSSVQTNLEVYRDHPGDQNPRFLTPISFSFSLYG